MDGEWIPVDELEAMYVVGGKPRFSRWTLSAWAKAGRFAGDAAKPGRIWWFRRDAVENLLAREAGK